MMGVPRKDKPKTADFVVIKKHTLGHKVGEKIKLTAAKARALSGKVRLAKDVEADSLKDNEVAELKADLAEAKEELAEALKSLAEAQAELAEAKKAPAK